MEVGRVVAAVAGRAGEHRVIVRIGVAGRAHSIGVAVIHREPGVVKRRARPNRRGMARSAGGRETCRRVIGIRRSGVIGFVTGVAVGRWRSCVIVIEVASGAGESDVCSSQGEWRGWVIERGPGPRSRRVAGVAGGGESRRCVVGIGGSVVIGHVTSRAQG